jgi:hypothetical protein
LTLVEWNVGDRGSDINRLSTKQHPAKADSSRSILHREALDYLPASTTVEASPKAVMSGSEVDLLAVEGIYRQTFADRSAIFISTVLKWEFRNLPASSLIRRAENGSISTPIVRVSSDGEEDFAGI